MPKKLPLHPADLIGLSRLANDATFGVTNLVEAVHRRVAFGGEPLHKGSCSDGITTLVYNNIRTITSLLDAGFLSLPVPTRPKESTPSAQREAVISAVNGVVGDYLVRTNNPLAIPMSLRRRGRPLEIERCALQRAIPTAKGKALVLAHGLCLSDLQWKRKEHDHGTSLSRDFGYTSLYLHYNTGLHVSENGRLLADLIEKLVKEWPVEVQELAMLGHSMGGLVFRSAYHYATVSNHSWPRHLRRLIFLGTPHHGAPLEQLGNWVDNRLAMSPYSAPFASIGKIRSAGITDMRYGNLLDEDWKSQDRFASVGDVRTPLPLPTGLEVYAMAATRIREHANSDLDFFGDGLVQVGSALGRHKNPSMNLGLSDSQVWVGYGMNHWDLLSHPAVYEQIRRWFEHDSHSSEV